MTYVISNRLEEAFAAVGVEGFVYAHEIACADPSQSVDLRGSERVVLASVFKIVVSVAFARAVDAGRIDLGAPVTVSSDYRRGGAGIGGCKHDVQASLGDLAELMMTLSDNAATDVVIDSIGMPAVHQVIDDLGLTDTAIAGRTIDELDVEERELRAMEVPGLASDREDPWDGVPEELLLSLSTVNPVTTRTYSTPRDVVRLLDAIWTDRAASPAACAAVRQTMARQVWSHRLAAGFDGRYRIAGKTGTLEGIRNESGVITTPDGRSFAIAVFTRSDKAAAHNPPHDAVIGLAARLSVDHLCSTYRTPSNESDHDAAART